MNRRRINLLRENLVAVEETLQLLSLSHATRQQLEQYRDEITQELRTLLDSQSPHIVRTYDENDSSAAAD